MRFIMIPSDIGFYEILHSTLPPHWEKDVSVDFQGHFCTNFETGILEPLSEQALDDYLNDGRYEYYESLNENQNDSFTG